MKTRILIHRYLSLKVLPIWTILLMDVVLVAASCLLAYVLRFDIRQVTADIMHVEQGVLWCIVVNLLFFKMFKTYSGVLRYSSFVDIMRIFVALSCAYVLMLVLRVATQGIGGAGLPPCSVLLMAYIVNFGLMSVSRMVVKLLFDTLNFDERHSANVFIYGAKEAGVNIAKSLRVNLRNHYRLRGFIADEPNLIGKVLMGVKVYANDRELMDKLNEKDVQVVIVSPAKMDELKKSDLIDRLLENNIKLMTAPPLSDWKSQTLSQTELKEIQIEDLLQREPIQIDIQRNHAPGGIVQPVQADTGGSGGDTAARHPAGTAGPLEGHRRGNHRGGHREPDAHGGDFCGIQAAIHLPRGSLQARADDGGQCV